MVIKIPGAMCIQIQGWIYPFKAPENIYERFERPLYIYFNLIFEPNGKSTKNGQASNLCNSGNIYILQLKKKKY